MAERPSDVSFSTQIPQTNGDTQKSPKPAQNLHFAKRNGRPHTRSSSISSKMALQLLNEGPGADPDDIFQKHAVSEVKLIQQRLRYVNTVHDPNLLDRR